jgi:ribosomal protein L12E/L44/L45/RPP1/RPP2
MATCILVFTFTQPEFKATAQIKIPWCDLPKYPILMYVGATFAIGLLLGFLAAAYYYIVGQAGIHAKKKEIKRLEGVVSDTNAELERLRESAVLAKKEVKRLEGVIVEITAERDSLRSAAASGTGSKKKNTATMKAVGEKDWLV